MLTASIRNFIDDCTYSKLTATNKQIYSNCSSIIIHSMYNNDRLSEPVPIKQKENLKSQGYLRYFYLSSADVRSCLIRLREFAFAFAVLRVYSVWKADDGSCFFGNFFFWYPLGVMWRGFFFNIRVTSFLWSLNIDSRWTNFQPICETSSTK